MNGEKNAEHAHTNKLVGEASPYLLQHAHNPVNWYPWGTEAFKLAKQQNKPIFLSVGYSTCYWCHVMERESFERDDVAAILNQHYIAIKVDREERPELDQQFMVATQLVSRGRGGWPNSVWLTPDGKPWMAGTYFPRQQFKEVLLQLADVWQTKQSLVLKQADAIANAIAEVEGNQAESKPISNDLIHATVTAAASRFDADRGGFGPAPKFPPHDMLAVLVDQYQRTQDKEVLKMVDTTLREMAHGGVYDQLGGGFHRYSTDDRWLLPHFEKMLYDNGQLMRAYTDGYLLTDNEAYRKTIEGIYTWLIREMTSPSGGFFSAIDSESDAEEGKFYVWNYAEILERLGEEDGQLFAEIYGADVDGNFRDEATGQLSNSNILHLRRPIAEEAKSRNLDPDNLNQRLALMRSKLLQVRSKREYPHLDDKVIAAWNGLMIESLAYAGRKLDEPKYVDAAKHAADFILKSMIKKGRLKRTSRGDQAKIDGYLNDFAFMAKGLLELHHATSHQGESDEPYLDAATDLVETLLRDFQDPVDGGFFFTADRTGALPDNNPLAGIVIRSKSLSSGGNLPSGNGVAAEVLLELSDLLELTGSDDADRYRQAARRTLVAMSGHLHQQSGNADHLLLALARLNESQDNASFSGNVVQGYVDPPMANASPGQIVTVNVRLEIDNGWHLYARNPDSQFLKPTTIAFESHPQLEVVSISSPAGMKKRVPALGKTLVILEGEVAFEIALKISQAATSGLLRLDGAISCQACDDQKCIAPESIPLNVRIMVVDKEK